MSGIRIIRAAKKTYRKVGVSSTSGIVIMHRYLSLLHEQFLAIVIYDQRIPENCP